MQRLGVSGAVRHIYVIRRLKVKDASFEVLEVALLTNRVIWRVTPCCWVSTSRRFEGLYCPPIQGSNTSVKVPTLRRHYVIAKRRKKPLT